MPLSSVCIQTNNNSEIACQNVSYVATQDFITAGHIELSV